jgi:glutamine amidotransferase
MLCVIPPNTFPSRSKLENSALNNPHGFGYAIAVPSEFRIHTFRTMNPDECINRFFEDREKYRDGYAIWHARFATHGSMTLDNCHPFMVGEDEGTYLAHNGILSVIENPKDTRSDTRIFAEDLLPTIGGVESLDNPQVWNMLEDFTTGSKVAILTVNPIARHQLYLLHESKGLEDSDKVWWSNDSCFLSYGYGYGNYGYGGCSDYDFVGSERVVSGAVGMVEEEEDYLYCHVCGEVSDYWNMLRAGKESYCWKCLSCYDCNQKPDACLCYIPPLAYENRTPDTKRGWELS